MRSVASGGPRWRGPWSTGIIARTSQPGVQSVQQHRGRARGHSRHGRSGAPRRSRGVGGMRPESPRPRGRHLGPAARPGRRGAPRRGRFRTRLVARVRPRRRSHPLFAAAEDRSRDGRPPRLRLGIPDRHQPRHAGDAHSRRRSDVHLRRRRSRLCARCRHRVVCCGSSSRRSTLQQCARLVLRHREPRRRGLERQVYVGVVRRLALRARCARRQGAVASRTRCLDRSRAYAITGAPQVAGKVVVIGNGGAEFDSRGYVSAYDLETGKLAWRFFTVPGDPSKPHENPALEMAAKTWDAKRDWTLRRRRQRVGLDQLRREARNLVFFGTANGAPWNPLQRSPNGGDNLFLASIVALNADTGEYVWHYQQTPGERWDYDATPHLMLATLKLDGVDRDVLMQASKNGFFYVHDRRQRRAAGRRQVRRCELGYRRRPEDRARDRESRCRLLEGQAGAGVPVGRRRAQLQPDVAVGPHRARLHPVGPQRHGHDVGAQTAPAAGAFGRWHRDRVRDAAARSEIAAARAAAGHRPRVPQVTAEPRHDRAPEGVGSGGPEGGLGAPQHLVHGSRWRALDRRRHRRAGRSRRSACACSTTSRARC